MQGDPVAQVVVHNSHVKRGPVLAAAAQSWRLTCGPLQHVIPPFLSSHFLSPL